jgi:hypothetical protein
MPTTNELFPVGYGLRRVDPCIQYLLNAQIGDINTVRMSTAKAKGAVTAAAGTWQTVVDVTNGSGFFHGACLVNNSTNAVTGASGLRITIDGTVFELTTANSSNSSAWATPCDVNGDTANVRRVAFKPLLIPYNTSLKVEVLRGSADAHSWAAWWAPEF